MLRSSKDSAINDIIDWSVSEDLIKSFSQNHYKIFYNAKDGDNVTDTTLTKSSLSSSSSSNNGGSEKPLSFSSSPTSSDISGHYSQSYSGYRNVFDDDDDDGDDDPNDINSRYIFDERLNLNQIQSNNIMEKLRFPIYTIYLKLFKKMIFEITTDLPLNMASQLIFYGADMFLVDFSQNSSDYNFEIIRGITRYQNFTSKLGDGTSKAITFIPIITQSIPKVGNFKNNVKFIEPKEGEKIILTADRHWINKGNKRVLYVNFRNMISNFNEGDKIHIGNEIVVQVIRSVNISLECQILNSGSIYSQDLVQNPIYSFDNDDITYEEKEDLQLCIELNIKVIVIKDPRNQKYYENLYKIIGKFRIRILTMVYISNLQDNQDEYIDWIAKTYDGLILYIDNKSLDESIPEKSKITKSARYLIKQFYKRKKPYILGEYIQSQYYEKEFNLLNIHEDDLWYCLFLPDRYLCRFTKYGFLQAIKYRQLLYERENLLPSLFQSCIKYCKFIDHSFLKSDTYARCIVRTAYDINASAILICSQSGRMAIKLSHYRPNCPIFILTNNRELGYYERIYHNIRIALYQDEKIRTTTRNDDRTMNLTRKFIFGIMYGIMENIIKDLDTVIFVFRRDSNVGYPNKIIAHRVSKERILNLIK